METKQQTELEQVVNPERSKEIIRDEKITTPDNRKGENAFSGIATILKRIWVYVRQEPSGTSGWAVAFLMFVALVYNIYTNKTQKESDWTSDKIIQLVKTVKSGEPTRLKGSIVSVEDNPKAPLIDRAIDEASRLQQTGKIDEAIEKWRCIAKVAEGVNDDLAAGVWYSVGYLLDQEKGELEESLVAYDKVIQLKPIYAGAYLSRGNVKRKLGWRRLSLADYNEAILRNEDLAEAYFNRGDVKNDLGEFEEAKKDFQIALELAEQQGDEKLKITIQQTIQKLNGME